MPGLIIFHHARSLDNWDVKAVGAGLRPLMMRQVLEKLAAEEGSEFLDISGSLYERAEKVATLGERLAQQSKGEPRIRLYSENVNRQSYFSDFRKNFSKWRTDFDLLEMVKNHGGVNSMFYRDIFWRFSAPERKRSLRRRLRDMLVPLQASYELRRFTKLYDIFFLPHEKMAKHFPKWAKLPRPTTLPPGGECRVMSPITVHHDRPLTLLYVGDVRPPVYRVFDYLNIFNDLSSVHMNLITRKSFIDSSKTHTDLKSFKNIDLSHESGDELISKYEQSDIALAVFGDTEYLDFAMPIKVFEAISFGMPIIVTANATEVARLVMESNIGWVVDGPEDCKFLLGQLEKNPEQLMEKRKNVESIREVHTWQARGQFVLDLMEDIIES